MSETIEFEIKKQFNNYLIVVKTMSNDKEESFYNAYGKDALVFGYVMKSKITLFRQKITKETKNFYII